MSDGVDDPRFVVVHERNRSALVAFGAHVVGDLATAEDIVQEVFVTLSSQFDVVDDPDGWLRTVVYRRCLNELRRRKRHDAAHTRHSGGETFVYPADVVADEDHDLAAALAGLSANQRAAALLCWGEGMKAAEAAAVVGCSTATLRVHLHRARRALRVTLGAEQPAAVSPDSTRPRTQP